MAQSGVHLLAVLLHVSAQGLQRCQVPSKLLGPGLQVHGGGTALELLAAAGQRHRVCKIRVPWVMPVTQPQPAGLSEKQHTLSLSTSNTSVSGVKALGRTQRVMVNKPSVIFPWRLKQLPVGCEHVGCWLGWQLPTGSTVYTGCRTLHCKTYSRGMQVHHMSNDRHVCPSCCFNLFQLTDCVTCIQLVRQPSPAVHLQHKYCIETPWSCRAASSHSAAALHRAPAILCMQVRH